jgi:hypothetical protein
LAERAPQPHLTMLDTLDSQDTSSRNFPIESY